MTQVSHSVSKIYLPIDFPSRVVLLSPKCDLTITDTNLVLKSTLQPRNDRQILLKSFNFSRTSCPFIPDRITPIQGSVVLLLFVMDDDLHVEIVVIAEDDSFLRLGDSKLPLDKDTKPNLLSSISCSESGHINILSRS